MGHFFFNNWLDVGRTILIGVLAYVVLVLFLRISGKRTLSKMNAFDLVVTVALGSTLATILLSKDVALAEGATAFAVLIGLQYVVAAASVRWGPVRRAVRSNPSLLLSRGAMIEAALRRERVTEAEVRAAVRGAGVASLADVEAVVLESDGSFSVIRRADGDASSLSDVRRREDASDA